MCGVCCPAVLNSLLAQLGNLQSSDESGVDPDRLVHEAAKGDVQKVKDILCLFPDKVSV